MIISSTFDYRKAAKRRLPPFLFHYIDGGAYAEETMQRNCRDLHALTLRQRILKHVGEVDLSTQIFDQILSMPIVLAPVGLTGMYARRGEVKAARAAVAKGIPFTLSSVSVCSIAEVQAAVGNAFWFQLYVLKDRGFMRDVLERSWAAGVRTLVFTVDMPVPGARYRDAHSGMSGPYAKLRRMLQAVVHPHWAWNVGVMGRPHDLGNVSTYLQKKIKLEDYIGWLDANFDPSIAWHDLQWIRDFWKGQIILKGILDPKDAREAVQFGADGIVVSNHGGRQLDGVLSTVRALPEIAEAVKGNLTILADSGVRSGLDVVRMVAQGADAVMIGRAFAYALAATGEKGVAHLLDLFAKEMRVAMTLIGVRTIKEITRENLVNTDVYED
ncbi:MULTISPECIES: FMN-dependent L-lactate dehydrogenase LldD [Bartonella]|uniref:L-lactate dehydrogenase n=1 Tax=Bartonella chomelii TaxID=236402 RepID=A0ABR6E5Z1_9HYPH|nr:FMN-dependent L-lactate dehydrogenase LldD [Bartonella schoenbuchensis]MBA9083070.1 L-lactate dehydrogenase (cytochrome) [Bartonella chomelii]